MRISICANCLENGATPSPVGHEKGHQLDPYHDTIDLCRPCATALQKGDFATIHARFNRTRNITVGAQGER